MRKDAEALALALGDAVTAGAVIRVLGSAIDAHPALLEDHRSRVLTDDTIEAAMTEGWTTEEIRAAMREEAAARLICSRHSRTTAPTTAEGSSAEAA